MRWFQLVADGLTVTEVADLAFVSQPAVSRALGRLDLEVGTPLLHKDGRILRMTQAGAAFKRHVDALLHQLDDGLAAVAQLVDPETGTVTVATLRSLGAWLVPDLIGTFRRQHPEVRFEVRPVRDEAGTGPPVEDRLDLEITTVRPADRSVQWLHLFDQPLHLAVPAGHRLAARDRVALAEVSDDDFVSLRPPSLLWQQSEVLCQNAGFAPRVAFTGEDVPTLLGFVGAGLGIALVPAIGQRADLPGAAEPDRLRLIEVTDPGAAREIGLGWSKDTRLLPSAELFRRHVVEQAKAGTLHAE